MNYGITKYSSLFKVLRLSLPYWKTLSFALIALTVASGINLSIPEIIRRLLNARSFQSLMENPLTVALVLSGIFSLQAVAFFFRTYLFGIVGHSVVYDLRSKLYKSLLKKPLLFFDSNRTGDLISRLSADTLMIQDVVSLRISVCVRYTFQVLLGIALMLFLSPRMTLLIVILVPIIVILARIFGGRLRKLTKEQQHHLGEATTKAEEALGGIRTVKAFNGEQQEETRFTENIERVRALGFSRSRFAAFFSSGVNLLLNLSLVIILIFGLFEVANGVLTAGDLTAFLLYGVIVATSFGFLASSLSELYQGAGAAERIFEILDAEDEEDIFINGSALDSIQPIKKIEFSGVSFAYPTRVDEPALTNLSFELNQGELLALVGPSGAGKTTVVSLLLRFYDVTGGEILIDGSSIREIPISSLRERIGLVPQDPLLFADSIKNNLRYAAPNATDDELREVCEKAAILEFIESLPEGFDTYVGERGVQVSGGQKQRLAIARALLTKPDLLILDEATSSLDSESEALIQRALTAIRGECAILAIAHRLSTIQNADKILVLHRGTLLQSGTHSSLIEEQGLYRDFVSYQELVG